MRAPLCCVTLITTPFISPALLSLSCLPQEYDYPPSQDGGKDPSGAGAMWSPPWWNGGSDSGGECGVPTARCVCAKSSGQPSSFRTLTPSAQTISRSREWEWRVL